MSTQIGIGLSQDLDPEEAAREAAQKARAQLEDKTVDAAFIFASAHYDPAKILPVAHTCLEKTKLVGCSTSALMHDGRIIKHGILIAAIHSENIKFEIGKVSHLDLQKRLEGGRELARTTITDFSPEHRKLLLFFADGLLEDISDFAAGIKKEFENALSVVGLGSIDDLHFHRTFQFFDDKFTVKGASAILVGDRPTLALSCRHGWHPLGRPRTVDKAEGNVIRKIDGRPAVGIYQDYLENETESFNLSPVGQINVRYPLGLRQNGNKEYILRNVSRVADDGSLVCQDKIVEGSRVHIMIGGKDSCMLAAQEVVADIKNQLGEEIPHLIFVVQSAARQKVLGRAAAAEIRMIHERLGKDIPLIGVTSYGEIFSPVDIHEQEVPLFNESLMVITL